MPPKTGHCLKFLKEKNFFANPRGQNTAEQDSPGTSISGDSRQWQGTLGPIVGATESSASFPGAEDAPSIRCKKKLPAIGDDPTLAQLRGTGKKKRGGNRGPVTTARTKQLIKISGKVKISWDPVKEWPRSFVGDTRLTSDIGAIARTDILMAEKWVSLGDEGRCKFWGRIMVSNFSIFNFVSIFLR